MIPALDDLPDTRQVEPSRVGRWLARGWADFRAFWPVDVAIGAVLIAGAALIVTIGWRHAWLLAGAFSGFVLPAPMLLAGLYELSRLRERGERPVLPVTMYAWRRGGGRMLLMGVLLAGLGTAWVMWSATLVLMLHGERLAGVAGFLRWFLAPDNERLFVLWCASGGLLASVVFALTAVSVPMLIDRPTIGARAALMTSVRAVGANPVTMGLWAGVIMTLTLLAMASVVGLVVLVPVLGHATWHVYRDLVAPDAAAGEAR